MEFLNEKNMIVDGVDKYYVSELKRVYGSAEYDGEEFVFLYDPEQEDTTRAYRPDSFVMAVMMDDEIFDGKVLQYLVTLSYDGHVKEWNIWDWMMQAVLMPLMWNKTD